jgi:nucleoside-diphosphate-sugar epimerase
MANDASCLITGAQGFLGQYFQAFAAETFPAKISLCWGTTSTPPISQSSSHFYKFLPEYSDIEQVLADKPIQYIVHLASVIPQSFAEATFDNCFLPNCQMMENLSRFAITYGIRKVVFLSTYGSMRTPNRPDIHDYYTLSKVTAEHQMHLLKAHGVATVALRLPSPYGEYNRQSTVINRFIDKALAHEPISIFGSGSRSQNFLYAGDVLRAVVCALQSQASGVYNLQGDTVSMKTLAEIILSVTGSRSRLQFGEQPDPQENYHPPQVDVNCTVNELGFEPKTSLQQGLLRTAIWRQSLRETRCVP